MKKKNPAYAYRFKPRPYPATNWLYIGYAGFNIAKDKGDNCIALHPQDSPSSIDWTCLIGRSVVIVEHGDVGEHIRETLCVALERVGVRDAYLIANSGKSPELNRGVNL